MQRELCRREVESKRSVACIKLNQWGGGGVGETGIFLLKIGTEFHYWIVNCFINEINILLIFKPIENLRFIISSDNELNH